jgi:hypothetical protein
LAVATSYLVGNTLFLGFLGVVNRYLLGHRVTGVFLLYPARQEYADALAFRWHQRRFAWSPGLVGIYRQGRNLGLIFGIPDPEDELRKEENAAQVLALHDKMQRVCARVGAGRKIFAGILPSQFYRLGVRDSQLEAQRRFTAAAVVSALDQLIALKGLSTATPILVIGGRGYIASDVLLLCAGRDISSIDLGEFDEFRRLTRAWHGSPLIVINLAKSGALAEYATHFWPGVVVLNEVYPEPGAAELAVLETCGAECFHVVGVAGTAWPPFPRAYRGGIPCCAALPSRDDDPVVAILTKLGAT